MASDSDAAETVPSRLGADELGVRALGVEGIEAIIEIRDRLTAVIESSQAANAIENQHWRPAPAPLPNLTPTEAKRANAARRKVMADVRAHPARSARP